MELWLRTILASYNQMRIDNLIEDPYEDPYDELLMDVLRGRANLKLVIWFKHREILEKELGFDGTKSYKSLYVEFIEKEIKKICMTNSSIDLFKDFNRCNDFFESVQKTMEFYVKYKLIKVRHQLIFDRINLFTSLRLINGPQYIICVLKKIEIQKNLFVLELE